MVTGKGGRFTLLLAGEPSRNPDEVLPLRFVMEAGARGLRKLAASYRDAVAETGRLAHAYEVLPGARPTA